MLRSGYVVTVTWARAGVIARLTAPFETGALAVHCARSVSALGSFARRSAAGVLDDYSREVGFSPVIVPKSLREAGWLRAVSRGDSYETRTKTDVCSNRKSWLGNAASPPLLPKRGAALPRSFETRFL